MSKEIKEEVRLMTSESVTVGHPDKFCDLVSNTLMDLYLELDPDSKIAIETALFGNKIIVGGEVTSNTIVDVESSIYTLLEEVGYGYMKKDFTVDVHLNRQSSEIFDGVVKEDGEIGAGDIGLMWGYATENGNTNYMPYGAYLSHELAKRLTYVREEGILPYLRPDGKTQVTVKYDKEDRLLGVDTVVVCAMHTEDISLEQLKQDIEKEVIDYVLKENNENTDVEKLVNPAGTFVLGFGLADAGLTGRKIIVDSYGGYAKHGGGNYNGKDGSKVDRSGAYMARYLAKNILHDIRKNYKDLDVKDVEVQLGYAIGVVEPVSLLVNVYSHKDGSRLDIGNKYVEFIRENISCTPKAIIDRFELNTIEAKPLSMFGHFGREDYKWEDLDIEFKLK